MLAVDLGATVAVDAVFQEAPTVVRAYAQLVGGTTVTVPTVQTAALTWTATFTPSAAGRWFVRIEAESAAGTGASETEIKVRKRMVTPPGLLRGPALPRLALLPSPTLLPQAA